jgi:transporter family protein
MMALNNWQFYALASAFFAALTAIFGKLGVSEMNSNLATFIRTIVILIVTGLIVTFRSEWQRPETLAPKAILFLVLTRVSEFKRTFGRVSHYGRCHNYLA